MEDDTRLQRHIQNKNSHEPKIILLVLHSLFISIPVYVILGSIYYFNIINGFFFLGSLIITMVIGLIFLVIYRNNKQKRLTTVFFILFLLLFFYYEFPLLNYESHTYVVTGYEEPEELLKDSGIHILSVKLIDIHYIDNKEVIRDTYTSGDVEIYELYEMTNQDRYKSKIRESVKMVGFEKEDFHQMGENVKNYIQEDIEFINAFLQRENMIGNSAGLALALTAMIHQGILVNHIPFGVTGTIEPNGDVLEVGMIKEKMLISEQKGLPWIILPMQNVEEAERVKFQEELSIEILSVSHIDEVKEAIKQLNKPM
ncbi:S16 family serine protease [Halalkalibacter flavus]|uniref:S16 family serine protease n=1 Tax=Halalkalibacter flavus TaxID=3090668 RepID=UPI002FC97643